MNALPAVMIGGPPQSGKSVLVYSLTQLLRKRGVEHYALRACPDGEGDFSQEAEQATVRRIRHKGSFTPTYVARICRAIQGRLLPLLVDVGGKPTLEQEAIFRQCTHAVLLASTPQALDEWREVAHRNGLTILAELTSTLTGAEQITAAGPLLQGVIAGLKRRQTVDGPAIHALADRIHALFAQPEAALRMRHLDAAPVRPVVEADRPGQILGLEGAAERWQPEQIPQLLASLPGQKPLALYGRAPNWVYVAAALHAQPAPFHLFDPRLGWVTPVTVVLDPMPLFTPFCWSAQPIGDCTWLQVTPTTEHFLDYDELDPLLAPTIGAQGVVISGRLPFWLLSSLARAYAPVAAWLAVDSPPLESAVVVRSRHPDYQPGQRVARPLV